jgi:hypothetical protein
LGKLESTYSFQLFVAFRDGKALGLSLTVTRNIELTLATDTILVSPGCKPECVSAACVCIAEDFVSADTRNAGGVILPKAIADPDFMLKRQVLTEERASIFHSGFECFALSSVDAVRE